MTARMIGSIAICTACLLSGCPKSSGHGDGGGGMAGTASAGKGGGGAAGAGGSGDHTCPPGIAIPTLCRMCADGTCGKPACDGKTFTGFVCPNDPSDAGTAGGGGTAGKGGSGGSGGVCNLLCVRGKHCVANPTPTCVDDADAGSSAGLHWVQSCGAPVCQGGNEPFDDPSIPNCTTEKEGQPCTTDGDRCDGVLSCGATLLCAAKAPVTCPISRARYKQDISYLDESARARFHDQVTQLRLASYRYKNAPEVPQLGFMIDDVEPSVAVSGDHVNLYGYLSMAVAAIQVQDQQIKTLQSQLEQLQARLDAAAPLATCR